ncbi:tRNA lysidine(34) synthetase TilS [Flavobacterium sp.]|uniref:tRNA lysidine(34) synthetase TilS n=1 Tax=Flavobacterium sp. TaxID=239 RepID=UPI003BDCBA9D
MLNKLRLHLNTNFPFLKGKNLFLAVSGGMDSMVLLDLFHQLDYEIAVLHCNFSLRDLESDGDEKFLKEYCENKQISLFIKKFDTNQFAMDAKLSIQVAARKLRYDWFYEQLAEKKFDYLLTAHHLDDSLETFLINLTRGTGLEGLTGIPVQNDKIIRPLLPFSRVEIENYIHENNLQWREDSSNASDKYFRNKVRHAIVPILKELNPNLLSSFQNTLKNLQQAQSLLEDASKLVFQMVVQEEGNQLKINLIELMQLPNYAAYLYQWLKDFGFTAWQDIYDLVTAQSGKQVFSDTHALLKDRDFLILYAKEIHSYKEEYIIPKELKEVKVPLNITFSNVSDISNVNANCIFVDEDSLQFPLIVRKWQEADYFFPIGMQGKKKLSKYFKDEKMSLIDKSNQWLLCSKNQVVWVIGKRQDDRYKINDNSINKLQITLQ